MGLTINHLQFIFNSVAKSAESKNLITIGRLSLYADRDEVGQFAKQNGLCSLTEVPCGGYSDEILGVLLNCQRVDSLDFSDYQGCTIQHDLNCPLPEAFYNTYDFVIDGGTLEHIFNVPMALQNYMNLLRPGGHLFIFTMANNHMGHGFYQFSPELFFRVFSASNGFETGKILLEQHNYPALEISTQRNYFQVADPVEVRSRVGLVNSSPVIIMVHAIKKEHVSLFNPYPIQSDYSAKYQSSTRNSQKSIRPWSVRILNRILKLVFRVNSQTMYGRNQLWNYSFRNTRFYRRLNQAVTK